MKKGKRPTGSFLAEHLIAKAEENMEVAAELAKWKNLDDENAYDEESALEVCDKEYRLHFWDTCNY